MEKIFAIGHKSPDLDSVAGPIAYALFKNQLEKTKAYIPARSGELNAETKYVLDKFGFAEPELIDNAAGKKLILVDHNEASQSPDGIENAKIMEIIDHHKLNFACADPIKVNIQPWGCVCTVVAAEFACANIAIPANLAGLMLSAILIDTVMTKSPTCTDRDRQAIEELSAIAGIKDWNAFGMELFKIRSSVAELSTEEIIKADFKDFEFKAGRFGIGQVETADLGELEPKEEEILAGLDKLRQEVGYHSVILFITDIINEGSKFLVSSDSEREVENALEAKLSNHQVYIPGIMSRKKQVVPMLTKIFDK